MSGALSVLRKLLPSFGKEKGHPKFLPIQPSDKLLAQTPRKELIRQIYTLVSVPQDRWLSLYVDMFNRLASLVQELPASEVHHHAERGGMLTHTLEVVRNALKLRQAYVLPAGAPPENNGRVSELWTYAVATAAAAHDIGKIAYDQQVTVIDAGRPSRWLPWDGPMRGQGYQLKFTSGRQYAVHGPLSLLMAQQVLPPKGLQWLSSNDEVWASWILAVAGQKSDAGQLGEIIEKADGASVAMNLGASGVVASQGAPKPLSMKILAALKFLLHENKLKLNARGGVGWLTSDGLWLVSKTAADMIRAQLLSDGQEGIPTNNTRLFDILLEHRICVPNGNQAIWRCTVDDGAGFCHELTMLRIDPARIWSAERRPAPFNGRVTYTEAGSPNSHESQSAERTPTTAGSSAPSSVAQFSETSATQTQNGINARSKKIDDSGASAPAHLPIPPLLDEVPEIEFSPNSDAIADRFDSLDGPPILSATEYNALSENEDAPPVTKPTMYSGVIAANIPRRIVNPATPRELGEAFVEWVRDGIENRTLIINSPKAAIHTVESGVLFVTPTIFQMFAEQNPDWCNRFHAANSEVERSGAQALLLQAKEIAGSGKKSIEGKKNDGGSWLAAQKGFQLLRLHEKNTKGENVWSCEVTGTRKTSVVRGYFISRNNVGNIFHRAPIDNQHLRLKRD